METSYNFKPTRAYNDVVCKYKVKNINLNVVKPQRGGFILYTKKWNEIYFGLGIDTITGEITDWAGGISYKEGYDKNVIDGAIREFTEETLGIFGTITYEDVEECLAIYNSSNLIIFKY